ncbi:MAG: class II fructose-bisphosphate aldolase [Lentimicrobiaceae bacterium]|jgi:fructose-bisphosphate aldolase class II/tagatose 1,6-diphosphate aldolase GatY/KbaY
MTLQQKLAELTRARKAILAVNFYNFETLSGIMKAAKTLNEPVILQLSESTINYLGLKMAAGLARKGLEQYGVTGWLHLDHGGSVELVKRCLDEGFDSVMIDASENPFEENVKTTQEVVKLAEKYNANVEAELGYVAKLGQQQNTAVFTQPEEVKLFTELTGVNALAIAIGSAHGFYKSTPVLQIELLKSIRKVTDKTLVLHGGSGIPDIQIKQAIQSGISKINLATETKNIFMTTLKEILANTDEIDLRKIFPIAIDAVETLISNKIKMINSAK